MEAWEVARQLQSRRATASVKPGEANDTNMMLMQTMADQVPGLAHFAEFDKQQKLARRKKKAAPAFFAPEDCLPVENIDDLCDTMEVCEILSDSEPFEEQDEALLQLPDAAEMRDLSQAAVTSSQTTTVVQQKLMQHEQKKLTKMMEKVLSESRGTESPATETNQLQLPEVEMPHIVKAALQPNLRKINNGTVFGTGAVVMPYDPDEFADLCGGTLAAEPAAQPEVFEAYNRLIDPQDPLTGKDVFVFDETMARAGETPRATGAPVPPQPFDVLSPQPALNGDLALARDQSFKARSRAAKPSTADDALNPIDPSKIALDLLLTPAEETLDPVFVKKQRDLIHKKTGIGLTANDNSLPSQLMSHSRVATWISPVPLETPQDLVLRNARSAAGQIHSGAHQLREQSLDKRTSTSTAVAGALRPLFGNISAHPSMTNRVLQEHPQLAQQHQNQVFQDFVEQEVGLAEQDAKHTLQSTNPETQLQLLVKRMTQAVNVSFQSDSIYNVGIFRYDDLAQKLRAAGVEGRGGLDGSQITFLVDDLKGSKTDSYDLGYGSNATGDFVVKAEAGAFFAALAEQEARDIAANRPCFSNRNNTVNQTHRGSAASPTNNLGSVVTPKFPKMEQVHRAYIQKYLCGYLEEELAHLGLRVCKNVAEGTCRSVNIGNKVYNEKYGKPFDPKVHRRAAETAAGTLPVSDIMTTGGEQMRVNAEKSRVDIYARSMSVQVSISERPKMGVFYPPEFLTPDQERAVLSFVLFQRSNPHFVAQSTPYDKLRQLCFCCQVKRLNALHYAAMNNACPDLVDGLQRDPDTDCFVPFNEWELMTGPGEYSDNAMLHVSHGAETSGATRMGHGRSRCIGRVLTDMTCNWDSMLDTTAKHVVTGQPLHRPVLMDDRMASSNFQ